MAIPMNRSIFVFNDPGRSENILLYCIFFVVVAGSCSVPGIKGLYSDPKYNYGVNEGMSPAMFLGCVVRQNSVKRALNLSGLSMPWSEGKSRPENPVHTFFSVN